MARVPLGEARDRLSEYVAEVERTHERVTITRQGHPAAVLISADDLAAPRARHPMTRSGHLPRSSGQTFAEPLSRPQVRPYGYEERGCAITIAEGTPCSPCSTPSGRR